MKSYYKFCGYADGAIVRNGTKKDSDGAGMGFVVFEEDECIGMWGKYTTDADTSYEAEAKSLLFGCKICADEKYFPVTLYNDCVTPFSLESNGFSEEFNNLVFKMKGKVKYIQHIKGIKNYQFHNERFNIADKIARFCREKKKDFHKKPIVKKVGNEVTIPLDFLYM